MKIRCNKCGCEYEGERCPSCGVKRAEDGINAHIDDLIRSYTHEGEKTSLFSLKELGKVGLAILKVVRLLLLLALIALLVAAAIDLGILSAVLFLAAILLIMPGIEKVWTRLGHKTDRYVVGMIRGGLCIAAIIAGLALFPDLSYAERKAQKEQTAQSTGELEGQTEGRVEIVRDPQYDGTDTVVLGRRARYKIRKAEKYIENGKPNKALKIILKNDFGLRENTRLWKEYYLARGDYNAAADVLLIYCQEYKDPALAREDPMYQEMLELREKAPLKAAEIDAFEHITDVAYFGFEEGHSWQPATCTEARYCKDCGLADGEPLGHDLIPATCLEAEYCSRCGEKTGKATGHVADNWVTQTEATCAEVGLEVGHCKVCNVEMRRSIKRPDHTPGEWVTETEATDQEPGMRVLTCTECGEQIDSEKYELTEEEKMDYYKSDCATVSYDDLIRYPEKYKETKITCIITIEEIQTVDSFLFKDHYKAVMGEKLLSVYDDREVMEPKFMPGDRVEIYGFGKGYDTVYTYEKSDLFGLPTNIDTQKVPSIGIRYAQILGDTAE